MNTPAATNWADVLAMSIAVTSIAITIVSVLVAFFLSRNYVQSIREVEKYRSEVSDLNEQVGVVRSLNNFKLNESMLAVKSIFDLMMLMESRREYEGMKVALHSRMEWKSRTVSNEECDKYMVRLVSELRRVDLDIEARQTELYWLVGEHTERAAHLHALTATKGDDRTLRLLDRMKEVSTSAQDRDELLAAMAALRQRIGKPVWLRKPVRGSSGG